MTARDSKYGAADAEAAGPRGPENKPLGHDGRVDLRRGRAERRGGRHPSRACARAPTSRTSPPSATPTRSAGAVRRTRQMRGTHEMLPKTQGQRRDEVQVRRRVPGGQVDHRRKRKKQEEAGPRFPQRRGRQARQEDVRDGAPPVCDTEGNWLWPAWPSTKSSRRFRGAGLRQRQVRASRR